MKKIFILFSLLFTLTVNAASHKELPAKGDLSLQVFNNANVRFCLIHIQVFRKQIVTA